MPCHCQEKIKNCLTATINARTIDAFFRGLSRGAAAKTSIEFIGQLVGQETTTVARITSIPVALITSWTSYTGLTKSSEEVDANSKPFPFFYANRRMADAFFRGVSRAEVTANCLMLIGTLLDYDLLTPAGVLGLFVLVLTTWSSYNRNLVSIDRAENADTASSSQNYRGYGSV